MAKRGGFPGGGMPGNMANLPYSQRRRNICHMGMSEFQQMLCHNSAKL